MKWNSISTFLGFISSKFNLICFLAQKLCMKLKNNKTGNSLNFEKQCMQGCLYICIYTKNSKLHKWSRDSALRLVDERFLVQSKVALVNLAVRSFLHSLCKYELGSLRKTYKEETFPSRPSPRCRLFALIPQLTN